MIAKKQKDGEMAEDPEQESAQDKFSEQPDSPPKQEAAAIANVPAKPPEPPIKPEAAPKVEAKPAVDAKAKTKPKAEAAAEAKPPAQKSMAEIMKFDLKIRKRPRF